MRFSGPLIHVPVHAAGIVLKPIFMRQRAILAKEIGSIHFEQMFLTKPLTIEHSGVESKSPLRLYVAERSATAQAIARLKDGLTDAQVRVATRTASGSTRPDRMRSILQVQGIAVGVALIAIGAFWVTPQLGAVGLAWTALAAIVTAADLRSWLVAPHRRR